MRFKPGEWVIVDISDLFAGMVSIWGEPEWDLTECQASIVSESDSHCEVWLNTPLFKSPQIPINRICIEKDKVRPMLLG